MSKVVTNNELLSGRISGPSRFSPYSKVEAKKQSYDSVLRYNGSVSILMSSSNKSVTGVDKSL